LLRDQADWAGAVAAYRESLDIMRELSAKDAGNTQWQMTLAFSLAGLALAGDDPATRFSEALAILNRLKSQGRLAPAHQGWISAIEADLAKLKPVARVLSPTVEQIPGTYDGLKQ
jgi:hypothetical protein